MQEAASVDIKENTRRGTGGANDISNCDIVYEEKNILYNGQIKGISALVSGTVTVPTVEVVSGDAIKLTRTQSGGSIGLLYVSTITNETSFEITSTSSTDASEVYWEIIH